MIDAVERNDPADMKSRADELDRAAGPHIEFEEHVLYPTVTEDRGKDFGAVLRREHQVARSALLFIREQDDQPLAPAERARVLEQLRVGLEHAVACGSLLSHLTVSDDDEQKKMLNTLEEYRQQNLRWTDLDGQSAES